jgi:hydrogenase small subunit
MFVEAARGAAAIVAVGSCASFGGIPKANPNPTGATSVTEVMKAEGIDKPVINISGCPPIPTALTGVLAQYLTFGRLPELDHLGRPKAFFGQNIHDRCYRRPFYERGQFAETFDDEGAKKGWCLFKLGCKGPVTYNACATIKWNNGAGFPIEGGHGCLGCSEPDFWDWGGFYKPLSQTNWGSLKLVGAAAAAGAAVGLASVAMSRSRQAKAREDNPS